MKARTIDNLPINEYVKYAKGQQEYDPSFKEAGKIVPQASVDVMLPLGSSELHLLIDIEEKQQTWAEFQMPEKFQDQKKRLFTHQIIPSLGTADKNEGQIQKF